MIKASLSLKKKQLSKKKNKQTKCYQLKKKPAKTGKRESNITVIIIIIIIIVKILLLLLIIIKRRGRRRKKEEEEEKKRKKKKKRGRRRKKEEEKSGRGNNKNKKIQKIQRKSTIKSRKILLVFSRLMASFLSSLSRDPSFTFSLPVSSEFVTLTSLPLMISFSRANSCSPASCGSILLTNCFLFGERVGAVLRNLRSYIKALHRTLRTRQ